MVVRNFRTTILVNSRQGKSSPHPSIQHHLLVNRGLNNGKLQTVGLDRLFGSGHQSFFDRCFPEWIILVFQS